MNKQVKCISDNYYNLTKGKIYDVIYEYSDCIIVPNDLGVRKKFPIEIFKSITDKEVNDKINPTYYGTGFDVIDFCQKNNLDFMQGNVIKYVTRYKEKNGKEDLLKAMKYIERMLKENYKEEQQWTQY